jgi:peptide chain release factor 1
VKLTVSRYVARRLNGLDKNDLIVTSLKGSGPGGQHKNKRETGIRMEHRATGVTVRATREKSQLRNRQKAFRLLAHSLVDYYRREERAARIEVDVPRETIKTYNEQRNTVKDHRTGGVGNYRKVLDGDIDSLFANRR